MTVARPTKDPITRPILAAQQFGDVRVLLLGHQRRARAERVGELDEGELLGRPEDQLLGQPADVDHQDVQRGQGLQRRVAVAHRVQAVQRQRRHLEGGRDVGPVQREGRARESARAQRHLRSARTGVQQTVHVAEEHGRVGHHVVAEGDGLATLEVGVARHGHVVMCPGQGDEGVDHVAGQRGQVGQGAAEPQAQVQGDLVIAAAARVQLASGITDGVVKRGLDVHVDVFPGHGPRETHQRESGRRWPRARARWRPARRP